MTLARSEDVPSAVFLATLVRARTCQNIGARLESHIAERAFLVGLFSNMEALIGPPLPDLIEQTALTDEVRDALLQREGLLGHILDCAIACERADVENISLQGIPFETIQECWVEAMEWVEAFRAEYGL